MKKMVENEGINFSKKLFGLFLILGVFVIFGMGVFMAYPSSGAGHNADEIDVQIGQTSRTLQQAITDGDFSVWAKSGNNIHYTSGNVGIGTTNPQARLHVGGSVFIPSGNSYWIGSSSDAGNRLRMHQTGSHSYIDYATGNLYLRSGTTNRVMVDSNGNVGIGETTNIHSYKVWAVGTGSQGGIRGNSDSGYGVYGYAFSGAGVRGHSYSKYGVHGQSNSGTGVYGYTSSGDGVRGFSYGESGIAGSFRSYRNPTILRLESPSVTCDFGINTNGWTRVSCSSDEKFKEDIEEVSKEKLNSISNWVYNYPLKEFTLKSTGEREIGVIAQEIQKLDASRVSKQSSKDGEYLAVETISNMELVIAIQELKKENNKMKESLCKLGASDWC